MILGPNKKIPFSLKSIPDSNHSSDQRWHFIGSFDGSALTIVPMSQCHFAHRADLITNGWFDVGPTQSVHEKK